MTSRRHLASSGSLPVARLTECTFKPPRWRNGLNRSFASATKCSQRSQRTKIAAQARMSQAAQARSGCTIPQNRSCQVQERTSWTNKCKVEKSVKLCRTTTCSKTRPLKRRRIQIYRRSSTLKVWRNLRIRGSKWLPQWASSSWSSLASVRRRRAPTRSNTPALTRAREP